MSNTRGSVLFVIAALGVIVGLILALTGAGGGILAVPLLVFGAHQRMAEAAPIGLLAVAMAATVGGTLGFRTGIVRYRAAVVVSAAGMFTSPLGLWLGRRVDNSWLAVLFAGVLLIAALRIFRKPGNRECTERRPTTSAPCLRNAVTGRLVCITDHTRRARLLRPRLVRVRGLTVPTRETRAGPPGRPDSFRRNAHPAQFNV